MWWSEARTNPEPQALVIYMLPGENNSMILEREEGKRTWIVCVSPRSPLVLHSHHSYSQYIRIK